MSRHQAFSQNRVEQRASFLRDVGFALRHGCIEEVETLVARAGTAAMADPAGVNLVGLLYELHGDRARARKCYGRAMRIDRTFSPAQQNMQRLYELSTMGRTRRAVTIGDSLADLWLSSLSAPAAASAANGAR